MRWSLAQACAWVATGDAALAGCLHPRRTIFEVGFTVFDGGLTRSLRHGDRERSAFAGVTWLATRL